MKKQIKIFAAAAVLTAGASMTSFAAAGWAEEDGIWYFYDKDGNKAEDEWKKSGDYWYWLDGEENGAMAADKLIEDGDHTYYVDSNGQMVRNTWVTIANEEQDDNEDPAIYHYYYMQSNGRAYKAGDTSGTKFRTIDGRKYAFDDDGKMLYGWVDTNSSRLTGEDDWSGSDDMYYCGNWDDGAMKTGWQLIYVHDDVENDEVEHWFNFKSNGKKRYSTDETTLEKKINNKKYGFDARGVMVYEWNFSTGSTASASAWKYYSSKEDGARKTKGWFKVIPPNDDNTFRHNEFVSTDSFARSDSEDESKRWYYANGDGELAAGEIKKIKGKYYAFRNDNGKKGAAMLSGLVLIKVVDGKVIDVKDDGVDRDELEDILDSTTTVADGYSLYYFGSDADTDGAMKTGSITVNVKDFSGTPYTYNFYFKKGGESRGMGVNGIDDNKYIYMYGCKIKADSEDKYQVVEVTDENGDVSVGSSTATVRKISSMDLRSNFAGSVKNSDNSTVRYVPTAAFKDCRLVNTSGAIVKSKAAAKDSDDWYFYVNNREIKMYTNDKNLKNTGQNGTDLTNWKTEDIE